jgi:metacaspase-1
LHRILAVLVGVDEYERPDIPPLRGCVNDVLLVRWLLKTRFDVANDDIHVLVNRRATKDNIVRRLGAALARAGEGDIVVFYFSGHGSQVRDRDGDELSDALDELICPHDMDWDRATYLIDDDLDAALAALPPGVMFEAFFDCCFWGAGPQLLAPEPARSLLRPDVRYLPPPVDVVARAEGDEDRLALHRLAGAECFADRNVLWAASQEGQPAAEDYLDGRPHGIFSYYGCRFIADNVPRPHPPDYSRAELLDDLREFFEAQAYEQRPEVAAAPDLLATRPFLFPRW